MDSGSDEKAEDRLHVRLLAQVVRSIRKQRRMKPSEVAKAMGLPLRTYEHFERGTGRMSYARIRRFALATDSDPIAIISTLPLGSAEFALNSIDNKLMTIAMGKLSDLHEELGPDVTFLGTSVLVSAFDKLCKDLIEHVRRRDQFAERWVEEKTAKLHGATFRRAGQGPV
jgi:transcriptional regulator with XRE-family HTH domain